MTSQLVIEAANPIGARLGKIRAIAVTTSSAITDLSAQTEIANDVANNMFVRIRADGGDVYYAFNSANSGTIDQTITTQGVATQCDLIPNGQFVDVHVPYDPVLQTQCKYLLLKGSVACTARLTISGESQITRTR